jgi:hypothetical protein
MMYQPCVRPSVRAAFGFLMLSTLTAFMQRDRAAGQALVGDPFITSYQNWIDPQPTLGGNWRLSLHNPTIMETANTTPAAPGNPDIITPNTGNYYPMLLVQNGFTTPTNYDLNARMYTSDDDLWGLVFGYQDPNNYYRVGFRSQANGNLGGTSGVSVQKVSGGVISQITPLGPGTAYTAFPTFATSDTRTPVDVKVSVTGNNYSVFVAGENGGAPLITGSDPGLSAGKIGIQSWAQRNRTAADRHWGTEVETISVTQGVSTLYSGAFVSPTPWRPVVMTNANGVMTTTTGAGEDVGNFGLDINDRWILQQTNGFENATFGGVDFIGPAVAINTPGATAMQNYQMRVRMGGADNDGFGALVRVQDDNNFYRVNFTNEATDAAMTTRAPRGMSVQKVRNGVWTELYRDESLFVYTPGTAGQTPATGLPMFDLSVGAIGNTLKIQVRDHQGNVITYPLITDSSDPLLSGSVGLHSWGTDNVYYTGYGGTSGPLVTALSAFTEFNVAINRATGNITLTNNSGAPVQIRGITIGSDAGSLNPATWLSVANNYDEPPQNGSVDPNDPWTILSSTSFNLSEREQSAGGDGATLANGQSINLGNAWRRSRLEDVRVDIELFGGAVATGGVAYSGTPLHRSDLNVDGVVNANDWNLFHPNLLADLSSMSDYQQVLAGDLDGDGDNDINDFALFKADFDQFNGVGAFVAMLQGVPEPSGAALAVLGGLAIAARRRRALKRSLPLVTAAVAVLAAAHSRDVRATDLTTFSVENFPPAATFPVPAWTVTPTTASLNNNADATVLYSPSSALNKRILATLTPGTDDDVVGFVLGFEPGDAAIGSSADYLLIDWKGASQTFDFADGDFFNFHHDQTTSGNMPVGLALSRVTGSPTADEFWQHADLPENATGGVAELARGATLGSAAYNRSGGSHVFDITYTSSRITVRVDGVQQFDVMGSFPDGRFGLYSAWQGPTATFSNVEILPAGFAGLSARVDRTTGNITLRNTGTEPVQFDFYEFDSASGSLNVAGWNSLSDQNFQSVGGGIGQSWDEAGGSDAFEMGEAYLQSMSTLAASASVSLGNAYNNAINGEDLVLAYRLPSGIVLNGTVEYIGEAPTLDGDYDSDGDVDGNDFLTWQRQVGGPGSADGNDNGVVDGPDLTIWRNNFGQTGASASAAAIPEPVSFGLALSGLMFLVALVRRKAD